MITRYQTICTAHMDRVHACAVTERLIHDYSNCIISAPLSPPELQASKFAWLKRITLIIIYHYLRDHRDVIFWQGQKVDANIFKLKSL